MTRLSGFWQWLFPLTYFIHIVEEYFVGGGYSAYLRTFRGVELAEHYFLISHVIGLALMLLGLWLAGRYGFPHLMVVILSGTFIANSLVHLVSATIHQSYVPGLVSSLLLWLPLGFATLFKTYGRMNSSRFTLGIIAGVIIAAAVEVATL